jgi:hypothetical protein
MSIYGGSFVIALMTMGETAGLGTALGFVTTYAAVFYLNGLKPQIVKIVKSFAPNADSSSDADFADLEYIYESATRDADGKRRYIFIKSFAMTKYRGGKTYVTHRQFRRLKEIGRRRNA